MNPLRDMFAGLGILTALAIVIAGGSWAVIRGVRRLRDQADARYDRWGIRTDEQARTKGCVGIEDPTGGEES